MILRAQAVIFALSAMTLAAQAEVVITIDKAAQMMSVAVNGEERHSWPVSTGRPGYSTPAGSFTAFRMAKEHYSKEWDDAPMPHSIFFTKRGHAIHGSLEIRRLGTPASHGCVRLAPANAEALFDLVKADGLSTTKVVITGEDKPALAVAKRTRNSREASRRTVKRVRVAQQRPRRARQAVWYRATVYPAWPAYGGYSSWVW